MNAIPLDLPTTLNWNLIVLIWWYLESNRGQLEGLGQLWGLKYASGTDSALSI